MGMRMKRVFVDNLRPLPQSVVFFKMAISHSCN